MKASSERLGRIASGSVTLEGMLSVPPGAHGVVLFAHGSGSSRLSPRNNFVAAQLRHEGLATLLIDLLTPEEDHDRERRFDIPLLVERLHDAVQWLAAEPATQGLPVGIFGASTGAAAALQLAAVVPSKVAAVVSRGGRPDLAGIVSLERVKAPTLLVVGGADTQVLAMNEAAYAHLHCPKALFIVPGATHLFEEPGTLEVAASHAAEWFARYLEPVTARS
ncbi:MAG: dienelactone hydrolase family protein [Betaproteobacteria bacterium]|nr:dienelactone hydrolase family protein [Betaproteobacteria bacterium]